MNHRGKCILSIKSFAAFDYITENIKKYPDNCLSTAMVIAYHLPNSFPTISVIANMTGMCNRTVIRRIKKLESLNLIKVKRRHRNSSIYTLILGDTIESLKESLGDKMGVVRVTNSMVLGDTIESLQHTSITYNVKEDDLLNNKLEDQAERQRMADEMMTKIRRFTTKTI